MRPEAHQEVQHFVLAQRASRLRVWQKIPRSAEHNCKLKKGLTGRGGGTAQRRPTQSVEDFGDAARGETLAGCIKVSAIMDSGTAESVASDRRECVADRRATRPPLVVFHHGSAFFTVARHNRMLPLLPPHLPPPPSIASRVVNRSLVSSVE